MTSTAITDAAPLILTTPRAVQRWSERVRASGLSLGMVPTMGALHRGHGSLMRRARGDCDRVLVSIFVNPMQFAPGEDFERYPRTWEQDLAFCADHGADAIYAPTAEAMYPPGAVTMVRVNGPLAEVLDAAHRPGHFDGVATVVTKLLAASRPDRAYFGRKDAQQCAVVRRLVADLDLGCSVIVCPTVRDADGLALSSRNAYLAPEDRRQALAIPRGLAAAHRAWTAGEKDPAALETAVCRELEASPSLNVDYVAVVDPGTLLPMGSVLGVSGVRCEILIAARIGGTRLIDVFEPGLDDPPVVAEEGSPSA